MTRTFVLILILVASVTWLLIIAVNPNRTSEPVATATPSPAQTTLSMRRVEPSSNEVTLAPRSFSEVEVKIDTGTNRVTGVQLELAYDPEILTNVDITPGTFFENPVTLIKDINTEDGRISFALAVSPAQGGIYGAGTVAVLTFRTASDSGQTRIEFLPKTLVSGEGIAESILQSATGLTLDLSK